MKTNMSLQKSFRLKLQIVLVLILFSSNFYAQLYTNGNFSTGLISSSGVTAPTGYTWSEAQSDTGNTTECNRSAGFAAYFNTAGTTSFQLADDFVVPAGEQWDIASFDFFIHQNSYTGTVPPIDQMRIQIWNGDPSLPTSSVVAGDMTTNVYDPINFENTFIYRIPSSLLGSPVVTPNTNRKVWKVRGNLSITLNSGTYWVVYQFHSSTDASIFATPLTVVGSRGLPSWNAKQNFVANTSPTVVLGWANMVDIGYPDTAPDVQQELPFIINETVLGNVENDFTSSIILYPNPATNQISISTSSNSYRIDTVEIFDTAGRKVKFVEYGNTSINISDLATGSYVMKVKSGVDEAVKQFTKE
jgi:hypothetical protein